METQVLVDKEKAIQQERNKISLSRKRTTEYGRELVEATESVKRQKMETDNIETDLRQKETELHCLKELLQGKEELNQTLKALVETKERDIEYLRKKLTKSKQKLKQKKEEVDQLRDELMKSSNELHQKQKQIIALEKERDSITADNERLIFEQDVKLKNKFEVSSCCCYCSFYK